MLATLQCGVVGAHPLFAVKFSSFVFFFKNLKIKIPHKMIMLESARNILNTKKYGIAQTKKISMLIKQKLFLIPCTIVNPLILIIIYFFPIYRGPNNIF